MSQPSTGEKTEKPTPKRLKESRREGQIARTNDLGAWLSVLAVTWLGPLLLRWGFEQCRQMLTSITHIAEGGDGMLMGYLGDAILRGALVMSPIVLGTMLISVISQVAQVGWAPKKMKPDLKRLNIFKGIKQLFGMRLVWETAKNLIKLTLIVVLSLGPLMTVYQGLVNTGSGMNVPSMAGLIAGQALAFLRGAAVLGLVLAGFDYLANKKRTDKQVKMSKHEVKQEHKQQEGDPLIKAQVRQRQMAMSRNRMMAEVPQADVVLVNPTHLAIALRYDPARGAPVVLAKGAGAIADKIRELAGESEVPIVRDVPLARTLYRIVDLGDQIPVELYEAVARILAFVYALRSRGRAAGTHDSPFGGDHEALMELEKHRGRRLPASTHA